VGDRTYLLYDELLTEETSADHALVRRQAQGRRIVPAGRADDRYAWLRQAEVLRSTPAAASAGTALAREHDLLRTLGTAAGLPRIGTFATGRTSAGGSASTLVLVWPASRTTGVACETLGVLLDRAGVPLDAWRLSRLCEGLAGLCQTLARLHDHGVVHRSLTPSAIIMLDNGRLVLRDLGLAGRDTEPGEGPADYQAPEQRRRGHGRPGAATDVYQLGAVAYHLITGHPPHPAMPPPARAQAPGVPKRVGLAVDAALSAAAADRPSIRRLGAALRPARDDLFKEA
jgi:protein kinase-like protein